MTNTLPYQLKQKKSVEVIGQVEDRVFGVIEYNGISKRTRKIDNFQVYAGTDGLHDQSYYSIDFRAVIAYHL